MKQKVLVTNVMDRLCFFLEEDGKTAEIFCTDETAQNEHPEKTVHAGDIYIGKVKKEFRISMRFLLKFFQGWSVTAVRRRQQMAVLLPKQGKSRSVSGMNWSYR